MLVAPAPRQDRTSETSETKQAHDLHPKLTPLQTLRQSRRHVTARQALRALNHWGSWMLVVTLVACQFTCVIWSSQTSEQYMIYGHAPAEGPAPIGGFNDEPYSDRNLVCVRYGRLYKPKQLSVVLASRGAVTEDTSGAAISGYRVVTRQQMDLRDDIAQHYSHTCSVIAATLDAIARACNTLGYNVVRPEDDLRIIDGIFSNLTQRVTNSLPVLILPFWDNAVNARYIMPGVDGSACPLRLAGQFDSVAVEGAWLTGVNRSMRDARTVEWLGIPSGHGAVWRNGWLEDPTTRMRWYSDVVGSARPPNDQYGIYYRQFDLKTGKEDNCLANESQCQPIPIYEAWGEKFISTETTLWSTSVAISNGTRYGLFLYEANHLTIVESVYDVATLISNTTVAVLLFRWLAVSIALLNAYRRGYTRELTTVGIGCLSCTRNFELLPLLLLPRLATALAAFFTAGCRFEGEQRRISEAWFAMYPALAEVMLFYYSVLNVLAKLLRRRMSDALFGPSLVVLCLLHMLRIWLANSRVFEFDGRISTAMSANEYVKLRLTDFFTSNAALRLNGNIWSIFGIKLGVLAINLLPLLTAKKASLTPWPWTNDSRQNGHRMTAIEYALGIRARESGGLGALSGGRLDDKALAERQLACAELVRFGYVVLGDAVVISLTDWLVLVLFAMVCARTRATNFRVVAFRVTVIAENDANVQQQRVKMEVAKPTLLSVQDVLQLTTSVWDITALPLS